eukprot:TRINITY_DN12516_c0_g1_i2.p1 TRINITY_DN12516_c0_g1~~TRINITY_DN12516_c0_g1_i2.p1  ORF type:complete len:370 (-),score=61.27 TRINITY_DN12516_c0_g1_i2:427-1536(-)
MVMLRSHKVRSSGLKFLSKEIPKIKVEEHEEEEEESQDDDDQEEEDEEKEQEEKEKEIEEEVVQIEEKKEEASIIEVEKKVEDTEKNKRYLEQSNKVFQFEQSLIQKLISESSETETEVYYPNKESLVINSLIACLEDENPLVSRQVLDFMLSHLPFTTPIFSLQQKEILIECMLYLLNRKDSSLSRRIYTWMFGKPDLENKYNITENNKQILPLIIKGLQNIFKTVPNNEVEALQPLKIIQTFYMQHDHLVPITLQELALPIIRYIYKYSKPSQYTFSKEIFKNGERFMENIPSHFHILLQSLANTLQIEIRSKQDKNCQEIIKLVKFTFQQLVSQNKKYEFGMERNFMKAIVNGILRSLAGLKLEDF